MRILLVEDDQKIAQAIKKGLEQESYAVDLATTGQQGLGSVLADQYDLVILDRMLPGIGDGLEIVAKMRQEKIDTPVLVLTARDAVGERVKGLNLGADDYLIKPFDFEELLARIRALWRRPAASIDTVLQVANLQLNTITFEARRGERSISLSPKEFSLLEYLMRHPNRTLSKDNIISHVWDFDSDILPNTVEVYVGYLRQKIDFDSSQPSLIKTIRGFGYKMIEEK